MDREARARTERDATYRRAGSSTSYTQRPVCVGVSAKLRTHKEGVRTSPNCMQRWQGRFLSHYKRMHQSAAQEDGGMGSRMMNAYLALGGVAVET